MPGKGGFIEGLLQASVRDPPGSENSLSLLWSEDDDLRFLRNGFLSPTYLSHAARAGRSQDRALRRGPAGFSWVDAQCKALLQPNGTLFDWKKALNTPRWGCAQGYGPTAPGQTDMKCRRRDSNSHEVNPH